MRTERPSPRRRAFLGAAAIVAVGLGAWSCCHGLCVPVLSVTVRQSDGTAPAELRGELILDDRTRMTVGCPGPSDGGSGFDINCQNGAFAVGLGSRSERVCFSLQSGAERVDRCIQAVWEATGEAMCGDACERADVVLSLAP